MRKIVPGFDVFELERDAKGVFCQAYDAFLEGNLEFIEKVCGESALVYFKTLLKKREVDNVCPKYNYLWDSEQADLIGGKIPAESNLPRFTFTIRVQEIHCNLCRKSNMVKDGAEDKVSQNRYNFVLTLHETPDFETTGHPWEIVEILPVETVQMLA
jgi:import inner membrane translocase subunit TIM44